MIERRRKEKQSETTGSDQSGVPHFLVLITEQSLVSVCSSSSLTTCDQVETPATLACNTASESLSFLSGGSARPTKHSTTVDWVSLQLQWHVSLGQL